MQSLERLFARKMFGKFQMDKFMLSLYNTFAKKTLKPLEDGKVLSSALCVKLACQGIGLRELQVAHERDSDNGVAIILKNLVTTRNKCIEKVVEFVKSLKK